MGKRRNVWIKSHVSEKLDSYLTSQEILGEKVSITTLVNHALEEFLDKNEVQEDLLKDVLRSKLTSAKLRPKWD